MLFVLMQFFTRLPHLTAFTIETTLAVCGALISDSRVDQAEVGDQWSHAQLLPQNTRGWHSRVLCAFIQLEKQGEPQFYIGEFRLFYIGLLNTLESHTTEETGSTLVFYWRVQTVLHWLSEYIHVIVDLHHWTNSHAKSFIGRFRQFYIQFILLSTMQAHTTEKKQPIPVLYWVSLDSFTIS